MNIRQSDKSAFTLVEMLVVVAIIGILCSILLPVIGSVRDKAWLTRTKEMLHQVSDAWTLRYTNDRAFPPVELITALPGATKTDSGDTAVPLSRAAINLLNWYNAGGSTPVADYKKLAADSSLSEPTRPQYTSTGQLLKEQYFERNDLQWKHGLLNVWGERQSSKDGFKANDYITWVVLDTNYDGKVRSPDGDFIRKSVITYCQDKTGKDLIRSWK